MTQKSKKILDSFFICPKCGSKTKFYDHTRRIILYGGRKKELIFVDRYRCIQCGRVHRKLPDILLPYKQYSKEIIEGVVSGSITNKELEYEDYPCDMTIKRWISGETL